MKPFHFALLWLAFFGFYLVIAAAGYILIPEGTLFGVAVKYLGSINGEDWDNCMGYLIFIGSALLNTLLVWVVATFIMKKRKRPNEY